jgi:hypothetical protein
LVEPPPESNRRPHPYHGTTRNRCAERRIPRSRPTVRVKVIGSLPTNYSLSFKLRAGRLGEQASVLLMPRRRRARSSSAAPGRTWPAAPTGAAWAVRHREAPAPAAWARGGAAGLRDVMSSPNFIKTVSQRLGLDVEHDRSTSVDKLHCRMLRAAVLLNSAELAGYRSSGLACSRRS